MKNGNGPYVSAVIVAAGQGRRMNSDINKQYIEIAGKPVLSRTLQVFEDCNKIDEIILVVNSQDIFYCKENIVGFNHIHKVKALVAGGTERQVSVYNGLMEVSSSCNIVLIHDGARPFISRKCIEDSIDAACEYGAACVAVPVKDTIKMADDEDFIAMTLERSLLWSIQTPQAFRYDLIMEAHKKSKESGYMGTDDAVLVERLGIKTKLVMGDYSNIKITTQEDICIGEALASD